MHSHVQPQCQQQSPPQAPGPAGAEAMGQAGRVRLGKEGRVRHGGAESWHCEHPVPVSPPNSASSGWSHLCDHGQPRLGSQEPLEQVCCSQCFPAAAWITP